MHTRKSMLAFALATLLGLGACGTATTQGQDKTGVPAKVSTVVDASTQSIHLDGVGNARQLGGYVGEGGRTVKDGVLLRTAALSKATEEDVRRLTEEYHLAEVIDLRLSSEVESDPELKIDGVKNLNLRIIDEEALAKETRALSPEDQRKLQSDNQVEKLGVYAKLGIVGDQMYVNFLSHDAGKQGYAQLFQELLALPEGGSLLFHCTQGKDRTGCAAMLILSALGVDEDTILADYMLTNEFNAELIEKERQQLLDAGVKEDELDGMMIAMNQVFPQVMTNALDWLKQEYGSVTGYLTQELGVTDAQIAQLQDKFLA